LNFGFLHASFRYGKPAQQSTKQANSTGIRKPAVECAHETGVESPTWRRRRWRCWLGHCRMSSMRHSRRRILAATAEPVYSGLPEDAVGRSAPPGTRSVVSRPRRAGPIGSRTADENVHRASGRTRPQASPRRHRTRCFTAGYRLPPVDR
jgi:hypothetical protein